MSTKIFVYGTLRKGGYWHWLLEVCRAQYIGKGTIKGTLFVDANFLPYAVEEGDSNIVGEVYEVIDEALPFIDQLEINYTNKKVSVLLTYGNTMDAVVYFWTTSLPKRTAFIPSGDYMRWINTQIERIKKHENR